MGAIVIVADANLIVYHFVQGAKTELAHRVSQLDDDWLVPPVWRHEFANALSLTVREAGLSMDLALATYREAFTLLSGREHDIDMPEVLEIAADHSVSVYDAEYVALALARHVRLVTEDKELLRKFPETAVSIRDFISSRSGGEAPGVVREKKATYRARRRKAAPSAKARRS